MKRPKGSAESRDGEPEIRIGVSQPTELKRARWPSGNPETEQRVIEQNESQPDKHNQERPAEPLNAASRRARSVHRGLMVKVRGRAPRPARRRGRTISSSARGAQPQAPHGPLI